VREGILQVRAEDAAAVRPARKGRRPRRSTPPHGGPVRMRD
jgi:hypothetical protein